MVCVNHSHENGVNTCSQCGEWLCENCSVDINGRIICKSCIANNINAAAPTSASARPPAAISRRYFSGFWLLVFSLNIPGVNYMYLGLIKRGLFFVSAFFAICFAGSVIDIWEIAFLIPILWCTAMFDGFEKRRLLNNGVYVPDSVDDILEWFHKYKKPVIIVAALVIAFGFFGNVNRFIHYMFAGYAGYMPSPRVLKPALSLAALCIGGFFIAKALARKSRRSDERKDKDNGGNE